MATYYCSKCGDPFLTKEARDVHEETCTGKED